MNDSIIQHLRRACPVAKDSAEKAVNLKRCKYNLNGRTFTVL